MKKKKSALYAVAQKIGVIVFKPLYRCKVIGRENVPKDGRLLICSNHAAALDPVFLGLAVGRQVHFMAKTELFKNKLIGTLLKSLGVFPVERGTGGEGALNKANSILEQEGVVGIFIEGTRSKTGYPGKPKTGAAMISYRTRPVVLPVAIVSSTGGRHKMLAGLTVRVGRPIPFESLGIEDESGINLRRGSRKIMKEITGLWAESRREYSLPESETEKE